MLHRCASAWLRRAALALLCLSPLPATLPASAGPVEAVRQIRGTGVLQAVDRARHRLAIAHEPIHALGMPAMTTSFAVDPALPLGTLYPGQRVVFTLDANRRVDTLAPMQEADATPPTLRDLPAYQGR